MKTWTDPEVKELDITATAYGVAPGAYKIKNNNGNGNGTNGNNGNNSGNITGTNPGNHYGWDKDKDNESVLS